MQQVIDEMESQIYELKSSDARNQTLVMTLNDQMNKLKEEKHHAMLQQQSLEQRLESKNEEYERKRRDIEEMNRRLQMIQEQKDKAEAQAAEERARLAAAAHAQE